MRVIGALVVLIPGIAVAGGRDHRHSDDSTPTVRDHRSQSDDHHDAAPVVRDHRSSSDGAAPVVRDHRSSSSSTTVIETTDVAYVPAAESSGGAPVFNDTGPSWTLEIGGLARRFQSPSFTRNGTFTDGDVMAPYTVASPGGDTGAGAFVLRATAPLGPHVYLGGELELGGLTRSQIQLMSDNPDLEIASRSMVGTAAVAGVRARQGIFEIGGELAGGVRILSTSIQPYDYTQDDTSSTEAVATPMLETRLRGAIWVHPHVYLGAQVGVGVLDRDEKSIGFTLGIASRSYAGR